VNARDHFLSEQHQNTLMRFIRQKIPHPITGTDDQQIISSHTTMSTNETSDLDLQQLSEAVDILIGGVEALNDDIQRLNSESLQYGNTVQSFSEDLSKVRTAIDETHSLMDAHKCNNRLMIKEMFPMMAPSYGKLRTFNKKQVC
jgi:hypothetical protein